MGRATLDVPEKAIESTVGALFGYGEDCGYRKRRQLDREEKHEEQEHQNEERDDLDSEEHGEEWEK